MVLYLLIAICFILAVIGGVARDILGGASYVNVSRPVALWVLMPASLLPLFLIMSWPAALGVLVVAVLVHWDSPMHGILDFGYNGDTSMWAQIQQSTMHFAVAPLTLAFGAALYHIFTPCLTDPLWLLTAFAIGPLTMLGYLVPWLIWDKLLSKKGNRPDTDEFTAGFIFHGWIYAQAIWNWDIGGLLRYLI